MTKSKIKNVSDCKATELGCKIVCYACHGSFYDLTQEDPTCPYCQNLYSKTIKKRKTTSAPIPAEEIIDDIDDSMNDDD